MANSFNLKKFISNNAIIILIVLLAALTGLTTKNFFSVTNFKNLVVNVSPRFIIACGVSGCLITKGTDLSAGRAVGLAACLSAMLLQSLDYSARMLPWMPDIPWPVALIIVMAIMACFGGVNGVVVSVLKVPPFIATLGMQTIIYGLCSLITNNQPMGGYKTSYLTVASGYLGPIPYDSQLSKAVMQQMPVSLQNPGAKSAQAYERIAAVLMNKESNKNLVKRGMAAFFTHIVNGKKMG